MMMVKTILITGSTDGIGKLTAKALAKNGHRVVLHGRDEMKLKSTVAELQKATGSATIDAVVAELSNPSAIDGMIAEINERYPVLDVLINNAGVYHSSEPRNANGFDMRFAVNYFAPVLLTQGLLPLLEKSEAPRVINLSSAAQSSVNAEALAGKTLLPVSASYAQSKLALTIWSFYLAKQYEWLNVIAVNPGSLLNTKMVQEAYGHHWSPAHKGSDILYALAVSTGHAQKTGEYFDNDKGQYGKAHADAYNEEKVAALISETERLLHLK